MSKAEDNGKESEEPDYDEDKDRKEKKSRKQEGEINFLNLSIGVYTISKYSVVYRKSRGIHIFRRR